jgi:broad specificity phosphatase PhoE
MVAGMPLLYLVRHGETDWNREKRWQGHYDRPLSLLGRAQAWAAGQRLASERISQLHSSDLSRAWQTAQIIGEACGVEPQADRRLREVDVGNWAGLTQQEAKEQFPQGFARRRAGGKGWEGGESYEEMGERVLNYVTEILTQARGSEHFALICHSGVVRMLVAHALHLRPEDRRRVGGNEHGAVTILKARNDRPWSLRTYNDASHLLPDLDTDLPTGELTHERASER